MRDPIHPVLLIGGELLVGRDELLRTLERDRAPVRLVVGETGIGKSLVLRALSQSTAGDVFSRPQPLRYSDPLPAVVLRALGDVVAQLAAEQGRAAVLVDAMRRAVGALAKRRGMDLARAFGFIVLTNITSAVAAAAARAVFAQLRNEYEDARAAELAPRVEAAAGALVLDAMLSFATEATEAANGRHLALLIDAGERLDDAGRRLLADLADGLPARCTVIAAYATSTPEQTAAVAALRRMSPGVEMTELVPLSTADVAAWQAHDEVEGVDPSELRRRSAGNPQLLGDMLAELRRGATLDEVPVRETFAALTLAAFEQLTADERRIVRRLAVLEDRPPDAVILRLTEQSDDEWADMQPRLQRSHTFTGGTGSALWVSRASPSSHPGAGARRQTPITARRSRLTHLAL